MVLLWALLQFKGRVGVRISKHAVSVIFIAGTLEEKRYKKIIQI